MTRNREKMALYEVMSKANWPKPHADKPLEQPPPPQPEAPAKPEGLSRDEHPIAKLAAPGRVRWLNRPRIVQLNAGRVEVSMPYQLAIAVLLGFVLLILVAFRLGQAGREIAGPVAKMPENVQKAAPKVTAVVAPPKTAPAEQKTTTPAVAQKVELAKPKGDNRIVIQSYQSRADLEPVRQYFAGFGIETEIMKIDDWYYLVTKNKYENPGRPGTDGYLTRQKIVELGAKYKAPPGSETFGSQPFSDAYGKKFEE